MSISRFGIRAALKDSIDLISGPGCPVCVTPISYIDKAIEYSKSSDNIVATFGDMFRVPGSVSTLEKQKSSGFDVRIVYSPLDCLKIAADNPAKRIIFLSVGFETTTPTIAGTLKTAKDRRINNIFILCGNKTVPHALRAILNDPEVKVDGFIMPAHVSVMIGYEPYEFVVNKYNIPSVITGFEALDVLAGINILIDQIKNGKAQLDNEYGRFARSKGNMKATRLMNEFFEPVDAVWRGFGMIEKSGLTLKPAYKNFDIETLVPLNIVSGPDPKACLCANIVKGKNKPFECKLFGKTCTPSNPTGACMVSSEGTCAAYYKYER